MAKVKGLLQIAGGLKGVSVYTMRGTEQVIMRTKGGPDKHTIKTSESCRALRENGKEWGGCTKAASGLRLALGGLTRLADYNISGALNALCKTIQLTDTDRPKGQRAVAISKNTALLTGFQLNRKAVFDQVVRFPLAYSIRTDNASAEVQLPAYDPALQLSLPFQQPLMRWVVVLGVVTDVEPTNGGYAPLHELLRGQGAVSITDWQPVKRPQPATTLRVAVPEVVPYLSAGDSLVLSIGLELGTIGADGQGEAVQWAGCAKVLGGVGC